MNNTTENSTKSSITFEVIRLITLCYFVLAIFLIITQIFIEYRNIKNDINLSINNLISSFEKPLSNSLWEMNQIQTDTIISGMLDSPYVLAIILKDSDDQIIFNSSPGELTPRNSSSAFTFFLNPKETFSYEFDLLAMQSSNKENLIGKISIYSGNKVILEQLSRIVFYIITNSILQTITLWVVLIFFINSKVRDPLKELLLKIESTNPQDPQQIDSKTKYNSKEFASIVVSFNNLIRELRKFKDVLEAIVENKTEMLKEKSIEVQALLKKLNYAQEQIINQEKLNSLGLVSAGIAHELKNPLNISINSIIILKDILKLSSNNEFNINNVSSSNIKKLPEIVNMIQSSNSRMENIIKNMLLQSRTEYSEPASINLNSFIDINLNIVQKSLKSKVSSITAVEINIDENIELFVYPNEFGRLLVNLFENSFYALAEKYNSEASNDIIFNPRIKVSATKINDNSIQLKLLDNGTGIKPELIGKIMDPFFTTKPPGFGTGLGLHLAHDIVKKHQGQIKINSKLGHYTEFEITLPFKQS